jgi:hypothetical protein
MANSISVTGLSDSSAPTVESISFAETSVNNTDPESRSIDITFNNLEDDLSGIRSAELRYLSPSGNNIVGAYEYYDRDSKVLSDNLESKIDFKEYSETGDWTFQWLYLQDQAGNTKNYYKDDLTFEVPNISVSNNNLPTGTPLLIGNFIPGEIIDVDLSGVSDPDNNEGFTPEYSYKWEVSSDGENWQTKENKGTSNNINIYVSGGNLSEPFYEFFLDAEGNNKLTNLTLDSNNTYTFRRLNGQTSHPFYITDSGLGNDSSSSITLTGDGSPDGGIRGDETITLSFNKDQSEINDLTFYCTSHSHMQSTFAIDSWEEASEEGSFYITAQDEGKQIRAHISYVDGNGTEESVTTDAFDIATRIDLTDENIRRFDPGAVGNINAIDFSTL